MHAAMTHRRRSRRAVLRGGIATLAGTVLPAVPLSGCESDEPDTIAAFLDDTVPADSSGTLIAALNQQLVLCRGWGDADRDSGVPAGCDTVYDVMSMTKQFTAAAILKLQMQGKLTVTDLISTHLGAAPPDKRGITVQQLLTHTAGLVDVLGDDYAVLSRDEVIAAAMASPLRTAPGRAHHYSNVGYSLLAAIIEEASDQSYEKYLAEQLFHPAGMDRTGYILPNWPDRDVAVEYDAQGTSHGQPFDHPWDDDGPYWNLRGNGGLLSTARDIFRWHRALLGDDVLDQRAKDELFTARVREEPGGDTFYAYGWVIADLTGHTVAWHNGGNGLSYGEIARTTDGNAMVFWITNQARSNRKHWDLEQLGPQITEGVLTRLLSEP